METLLERHTSLCDSLHMPTLLKQACTLAQELLGAERVTAYILENNTGLTLTLS